MANFSSNELGHSVLVIITLFTTLAIVAVALRFASIRIRQRRPQTHDLLITLGLVCA